MIIIDFFGKKLDEVLLGIPVGLLLAILFGYPPFAFSRVFYAQFKNRIWSVYSRLSVLIAASFAIWVVYDANLVLRDSYRWLLYYIVGLVGSSVLSLTIIGQATTSKTQIWPTRLFGILAILGTLTFAILMGTHHFDVANLGPYSSSIYGVMIASFGAATIALLLSVFVGLKPESKNEKGRILDAAS
ncbi:MAG: hypothetical protein AAGF54_00650 [Pseudomonadota bacterium]